MSEPYIGEIRIFAGNFAPSGWMFCEGQLLPISEYDFLFALIGTTYGGNGQTNFALPDLRGRIPIHHGTGFGLSNRVLGIKGGVEVVTLTTSQIPQHTHLLYGKHATAQAATGNATHRSPLNAMPASGSIKAYSTQSPTAQLNAITVQSTGGNQPHSNLQPYLCVNHIICLSGIFPPRS